MILKIFRWESSTCFARNKFSGYKENCLMLTLSIACDIKAPNFVLCALNDFDDVCHTLLEDIDESSRKIVHETVS